MDYMAFVEYHQASKADITIGCLPCDDERAQDFGLMKIDDEGRVVVRLWLGHNRCVPLMGWPPDSSCVQLQMAIRPDSVPCGVTLGVANAQDFAEKPKGDALKAMQVDTTVLGALPRLLSRTAVGMFIRGS